MFSQRSAVDPTRLQLPHGQGGVDGALVLPGWAGLREEGKWLVSQMVLL